MDLTEQFDGYCERVDFTYWSEPVNALTNAAFLIAAFTIWRRLKGHELPIASLLVYILTSIGIGSYLFHTHATGWAAIADVAPIGLFILTYLFAVGRDFLNWRWWGGVAMMVGFIPFALIVTPLFERSAFFGISDFYWNVPVLLMLFAPFVARKNLQTAAGMVLGAAILTISITLRSYDMPICEELPLGSHFWWHILNGVMLGWMIEVYRRHMVGNGARPS